MVPRQNKRNHTHIFVLFNIYHIRSPYSSGDGRLLCIGMTWRDCAVVQTPVFAPVQETVRWRASRCWRVPSGVAGGASDRRDAELDLPLAPGSSGCGEWLRSDFGGAWRWHCDAAAGASDRD